MEIVALLLIIGAWEACKAGYRQLKDHSREARKERMAALGKAHPKGTSKARRASALTRHDAGYWAGEAVHLFPQFRHGFIGGWHDHQSARDQAYADRQRRLADHLESRRGIIREVREHRERADRARKAIADEQAPAPVLTLVPKPESAPEPAPERTSPDPVNDHWDEPLPDVGPAAPKGWGWRLDPATGCWEAPPRQHPPERPEAAPETPRSGPPAASGRATTTTEGAPVATTETTYTQDIAEANAIVAEAEQHLADLKRRRWMDRMESLAHAGLDSDTLSTAADMNDSINAQIKAAEQTIDHATAFRDGLVKTHSAGAEYHQGTQGGGAEKSYLAE